MNGFAEQWAALPPFLAAHIQLTMLSLAIGILVSLPLGIAASRRPRLERVALGIASVAQTIPGLALMALMVPMLGALGPPGESRTFQAVFRDTVVGGFVTSDAVIVVPLP